MSDITITKPEQFWQELLKMMLDATYTKVSYLDVTMKLNQLQMEIMQAQQQNQRAEAMRAQQAEMLRKQQVENMPNKPPEVSSVEDKIINQIG